MYERTFSDSKSCAAYKLFNHNFHIGSEKKNIDRKRKKEKDHLVPHRFKSNLHMRPPLVKDHHP